jgi:hypothetical protein
VREGGSQKGRKHPEQNHTSRIISQKEPWEGEADLEKQKTLEIKSHVRKERSQKGRKNPEQKPHKRGSLPKTRLSKKSWEEETWGERNMPHKESRERENRGREKQTSKSKKPSR